MKRKLNMMGDIDDDLIERANPENIKPRQRKFSFKTITTLAACLAIAVVAVNLAIFLPMGNDEPPIIGPGNEGSTLGGLSYDDIKDIIDANRKPQYNGSVDGNFSDGADMAPGMPDMDSDSVVGGTTTSKPNGSTGEYVEVTDNQVNGVIEADIFKRTTTHIFYIRGASIYAYSIEGESSKEVGSLVFTDSYSYNSREMYLSANGKTATIIHTDTSYQGMTRVSLIDVSSPENMKVLKCTTIKGKYEDSRYVNGELLVFTRFQIKDTDEDENYIPAVDDGDGFTLLSPEQIVAPQKFGNNSYLVVSKISEKNLSYAGSLALLGFDSTLYVSKDSIYATRAFSFSKTENNIYSYGNKTEIVRLSYAGDLLNIVGSVMVNGRIKDQYSMDEYEGILRVFTTVNQGYYPVYTGNYGWDDSVSNENSSSGVMPNGSASSGISSSPSASRQNVTSASLYCIELGEEMKVVASVECFAPQGETVQSARFDGDSAYVCTAIVFTDPVFVFDLSDLQNITYKDTGVIEGYSHSLIELKDGLLFGIGQTDWSTIKLELYKEGENGLNSLSKVEIKQAYGTSEYKAHYINREEMIFGFAYRNYYEGTWFYSIYKVVDNELTIIYNTKLHECNHLENCRGVLIDNYFYILTDSQELNFIVLKIN